MERFDSHTPGRHRLLPVLALAAMAVLLALAGVAVARYVLQQQEEGLASAADFYFTSDYLQDSSRDATYYLDHGTVEFSIELRNFADAQRFSSGNIEYSVDAEGATVTDASGMLTGGQNSAATVKVKPAADAKECTITAKSSPYRETLVATFVLAPGNRYTVEDTQGNTAAVLTFTCADGADTITIKLPSDVVPDATDSRVALTDAGCTFKPDGPGAYSLVLLKTNKEKNLTGEGDFDSEISLSPSPTA